MCVVYVTILEGIRVSCSCVLIFDILPRGKLDRVTDNRKQDSTIVKFHAERQFFFSVCEIYARGCVTNHRRKMCVYSVHLCFVARSLCLPVEPVFI
jgi:hypothetical protein